MTRRSQILERFQVRRAMQRLVLLQLINLGILEQFLIESHTNQNQSNHNSQSEEGKIPITPNEKSNSKQPNCLKRGKTHATKS